MSHESEAMDGTPTNRRLRAGMLAVAAGAGCVLALWQLPGDQQMAEMAAALLALVLLVGGTLAVGSSAPHRTV